MPSVPAGCTLIQLETVGSTNDEARSRATAGAVDGTVVWALEQTSGRGRRGREWSSPAGNLYTSTIIRPNRPAADASQLSLVAAVALADALVAILPDRAEIRCKWPNDVLIDGAKTAGILLESSGDGALISWVVIGCGVNVASHPDNTDYATTDLGQIGGKPVALERVLEAFLEALFTWRDRWLAGGIAPVRDAWIARAAGLGGPITVRLPNQEISGRFTDMDADGALVLELPDGAQRRITAGDVFLPEANR